MLAWGCVAGIRSHNAVFQEDLGGPKVQYLGVEGFRGGIIGLWVSASGLRGISGAPMSLCSELCQGNCCRPPPLPINYNQTDAPMARTPFHLTAGKRCHSYSSPKANESCI